MSLLTNLIFVSHTYCQETNLSRARVSTLVLKSGKRLDDLAQGRSDIATRTYERAMQWFSDHWPETTDWPEGVDRPIPAKQAACQREPEPNSRIQGDPK